jgi:hypothetical protein
MRRDVLKPLFLGSKRIPLPCPRQRANLPEAEAREEVAVEVNVNEGEVVEEKTSIITTMTIPN